MLDRLRVRRHIGRAPRTPHPARTRALLAITALILLTATGTYLRAAKGPHTEAKPPTITAALAIPDTIAIPGAPPRLPWPTDGQAGLYVKGIGDFGRVSPTTRSLAPTPTTAPTPNLTIASPDPIATTTGPIAPARAVATPAPIASVAKIMTAYLTLRTHPLQPGDNGPDITISRAEAAAYPRENAQGQSVIAIKAGEVLTERQALIALMLPSANNIARILARWVAGSIPAFLTQMNGAATALAMANTRYTDPSGFDSGTVSTADDQIRLAEIALTIPAFAQIVSTRNASVPVAGAVRNVNRLLGKYGIDGVKTGSMSAAGGNLVFAATATIDNRHVRIIGAVLNQGKGLIQAFAQSQTLILAARKAIQPRTLIKAGQIVAITSDQTPLRAAADLTVLGWPGLRYHAALNLSVGTSTLALDGPCGPVTINLIAG